ncbi:hypothetical protein BS47DRAFT_1372646 [Hydnum rufescens UP504]|uniref:Aromatic amino acid beta-eliminating lyase/threonine aldolase domain-containing protein n=1 Tax=Hydnum rufescens UP504 TaxID=1448309 RepID=A0A9P6AYD2_9AGAM|nr:hypothetical protein BS47DRAFT_1372646 [Hydnum rufescens UP504]
MNRCARYLRLPGNVTSIRLASSITGSPAARDFRSDTVTTPTKSMFDAMALSSLGDDGYGEDTTTNTFEHEIASSLGHEAGVFVASGTMGNQLATRSLLSRPPHSILGDHRSHILNWEAGGAASLSQAMTQSIVPRNGVYLTLEDIQRSVIISDDVHDAPTRLIALENTLGGAIMPLAEVQKISAFARSRGIKLHLDGARLWHAVAAGAGTLKEYGSAVDTVSLCFSKGLGAPIGSVLVGSAITIKHARWVRKSVGGGMRQIGILVNAAKSALAENFPERLVATHVKAKYIEERLFELGVKTVLPVDTSMLFLDLEGAGIQSSWLVEEGAKRGLRLGEGGRIVVHHQISDEAVTSLIETVEAVLQQKREGKRVSGNKEERQYGAMNH